MLYELKGSKPIPKANEKSVQKGLFIYLIFKAQPSIWELLTNKQAQTLDF